MLANDTLGWADYHRAAHKNHVHQQRDQHSALKGSCFFLGEYFNKPYRPGHITAASWIHDTSQLLNFTLSGVVAL